MTYKETLFFVGKCLTITHEKHNKDSVENEIISGKVDWDSVVKLSTAHYVFPALYCNLKRTDLLKYIPHDLAEYMEHITNLNRERNLQIIEQAQEINDILLTNNITPIFLKGTGNLLEGLYEDAGERMVGDIDFIINPKDYNKTIEVLEKIKYTFVVDLKYNFPSFKHYPRIHREDKIAAVEIHKEIIIEKHATEFNFTTIKNSTQTINNINVLSYQNQLCLSIIAKQINDNGYRFNDIALRNAYDVYLLSKKVNAKECFESFKKLKHPLNNFLASCYLTMGKVDSLAYNQTKFSNKYINVFIKLITNQDFRKNHFSKQKKIVFIQSRLAIIFSSLFNKEIRKWLYKRLTDNEFKKQLKKLN